MRVLACLVAITVLSPSPAGAQTTTADGVQALVGGDYVTAARILRPLAEEAPQPEPLAQFFMATLYHGGHGVARNEIRACGLYLRAATITNPLQHQSLALAQSIYRDQPFMRKQCVAARVGIWRDPPLTSVALGRDHSVQIDAAGFVVDYRGTRHRAAMPMGGVGWVFLPIRYTQLDVTRPVAARRHFIEFFFWMPIDSLEPAKWALLWSAYEVVGAETRAVSDVGTLAIITAAEPPASLGIEDAARIRVNAEGDVEWAVSGAHARDGVIPSTDSTATLASVVVSDAPLAARPTSTDAAISAFVRQDYRRAAEILKPVAESWPPTDRVAEFLMAALYEGGHGVRAERTRACALFVRASAGQGPVAEQSDALVRAFQQSLGADAFDECLLLARVGFDHGFQPVTFMLDANHWITLDLSGAAVTYEGNEQRTDPGLARPGSVFLPIHHTELTSGATVPIRRHFIEVFTWTSKRSQTWVLSWRLFEVVRMELVSIADEELLTVSGARPPGDTSLDLRELARVRVDDHGNAEWSVMSGANLRSGIIESESERQAAKAQARARDAADARVDWSRTRDRQRVPALAYVGGDGCRSMVLYGWSADRTEAITIRVDNEALGVSKTPRTFDLASQQISLELLVHIYESPLQSWPFCTDHNPPTPPEETWQAIAGAVTIVLSTTNAHAAVGSFGVRVTITISGAEFVSAAGGRVKQLQPITLTALVGWGPG